MWFNPLAWFRRPATAAIALQTVKPKPAPVVAPVNGIDAKRAAMLARMAKARAARAAKRAAGADSVPTDKAARKPTRRRKRRARRKAAPTARKPANAPRTPAAQPVPVLASDTVTTATGRKVAVRYEIADTANLTPASGALQPRDRSRAASAAQIALIAANLDPDRLMHSAEADRGAPIVGPDGIIESGNGRVHAIICAARRHPAQYRVYLARLRQAGYAVPDGAGMPILIRRRVTTLDAKARAAFVREANQSAIMRLSASEQARIDAEALTPGLLASYDPDVTGGPLAAANRPFVRRWMTNLPEAEHNAVVGPDGGLSADGVRRIQGAMLARAYQDGGTLARAMEGTDDTTRAITGALIDAAPGWARLRAAVEAERTPAEFDLTRDLVRAVELVRVMREKGLRPRDMLGQGDMFAPLPETVTALFCAMFNATLTRPVGRPVLADRLRRYAADAERGDGGLLGGAHRVTPARVLQAVLRGPQAVLFPDAAD
jgi:hypothetical protein